MNDKNPKKKSSESYREWLRKYFPFIDRALYYYSISLPLITSLLVLIFIQVFQPFGIKSGLFDPSFRIGLGFTIWGFVLALITVILADRRIDKLEKSIREIKEFVNFKDEKPKVVEHKPIRIKIRPHSYKILFLIGLIFLVGGYFFYMPPNQIPDRPGAQTWEGISLTHNDGFNFTSFEFNFDILANNQYLYMYYNVFPMKAGTHYALLILPYVGKLENISENGWKQYNVSSSNTSILYKEFYCAEDYSYKCHDDKNLIFDFQDKIDAKQYYIHSINIPFARMLQPATVDKVDEILKGKGNMEQGWKNVVTPPTIRVTVNESVTQLNPIPDGYMTSFRLQPQNTASVFVWSLPDHDNITYHLDYTNPGERRTFDDQRNVSLIMFGSSASFLGIALVEYRRREPKI